MRPLSASELLDVWERGRGQPPVRQALLLLEAACPEETPEALADLPVGRRDARLLTLRAWTLGPRLESVVACPACGEKLEFTFSVDDVPADSEAGPSGPRSIRDEGYEVIFRLPNSHDVADVARRTEEGSGDLLLLERCLVDARYEGETLTAARLPETLVAAIIDDMARSDSHADVRLVLSCPACGHRWTDTFDIVSYFWQEIEWWTRRLLQEVHRLAAAYGWREADILAMSAWRRQQYLDLIDA